MMNLLPCSDLFEAARQPGDNAVEIEPGRNAPPKSPRFVFGDIPAELNRVFYNETIIHPVHVVSLRHAGVAGDGFPIRDGTFLTANAYFLTQSYIGERLQGTMPSVHRREPGRAICLSAPGYRIYGHWLVDILPKLHLLDRLGIDLAEETLVMPSDTPAFGRDWLRLLGVEPRRLVTYDPLHEIVTFDELVLPLQLRANSRTSGVFSAAVNALLGRVGQGMAGPSPVPSDRIYLSRQHSGHATRQLVNAAALEDVARLYGYTVVYPESYSLLEQVALFQNARFLAGEYGSALHGSIFAGPGCIVCAIRGTGSDLGFLQSALCEGLGQTLGYVFGRTSTDSSGNSLIEAAPEDLQAALQIMNQLVEPSPVV